MPSREELGVIPSEQTNLAVVFEVFVVLFVVMALIAGVGAEGLPNAPPAEADETKPPAVVYGQVLVTGGDKILLDGQEVTEEELVAKLLERQRQSQTDGTVLIGQSADADKYYFYDVRKIVWNAGLHYTEDRPARETS